MQTSARKAKISEINDLSYEPKMSMLQNDLHVFNMKQQSSLMVTVKSVYHGEMNCLTWKTTGVQAESRLQMLKRRLHKNAILHKKYKDFTADLLDKHYSRKVTSEEQSLNDKCYLPHHPVFT